MPGSNILLKHKKGPNLIRPFNTDNVLWLYVKYVSFMEIYPTRNYNVSITDFW